MSETLMMPVRNLMVTSLKATELLYMSLMLLAAVLVAPVIAMAVNVIVVVATTVVNVIAIINLAEEVVNLMIPTDVITVVNLVSVTLLFVSCFLCCLLNRSHVSKKKKKKFVGRIANFVLF
jgi:hypothetical protein